MTASVYSHIRSFHLPYLQEFRRLGWETHVACAGIPADAPYVDRAIELPFEKKMSSPANFRAARILRGLIRKEQYDLIITHTSLASFFTRLALKGMKNRPRLVNVMHGYLFDENTPLPKRSLLLDAERLTAPETDLLLLMNEWDLQTAKRFHLGQRIEKIPGMGVDFDRLDQTAPEDGARLRKELGIPADDFVLLYPAEFSGRKSQHVLIETMQLLPENVRLVLCGDGDLLPACKALAEQLQVSGRVLLPGRVRSVAAWYRMADALAASSRSEGLPFNVMEAMHMGLPVIASNVKGHSDLIADGTTGLIYPYGQAEACAMCVKKLMGDPQIRRKMAQNAADEAERFALPAVLDEVMAKYLSVLRT